MSFNPRVIVASVSASAAAVWRRFGPRIIFGAPLAMAAAIWLLAGAAERAYYGPKRDRLLEISKLREEIGGYEKGIAEAERTEEAIAAYADRTLGADQETVDHRLRTRLNRIAEQVGIRGAVVSTGARSVRQSPARRNFTTRKNRHLRDEIDFVELDGAISGEGTLAEVVSLIDRIDAEPWLKRIDQLRLDPKSNGDRVAVTIRLTTLYLPGRLPRGELESEWSEASLARFGSFVDANPFRIPPPPPPPAPVVVKKEEAPPPTPSQPPPPKFPWKDWVLTGVAAGPNGDEAWLRNRASGETRRLSTGEDLNRAVLAGITADWAEFRLDGRRFRVQVGRSLNDRTPLNE